MAKPYELDWARLPLQGAHNVRDLGGVPVRGGGMTRYHRFLRSDWLWQLTAEDRAFLRGYGVSAVIDLRDPSEVAREPDPSLGPDVAWANFPLLELDISDEDEMRRRFEERRPGMEEFYDMVLASRGGIANCFRFIAEAPAGCVLFHCMAGKDRTGNLAMLLMALAGCDKWDCVASYVPSRLHMMRDEGYAYDYERQQGLDRENFCDSPAHAIEHSWDVVQAAGGVVPFLRGCGVTNEELAAVRARLLEENPWR